jgi:YfiH family protein
LTLHVITGERLKGISHGFFTRVGGSSSGIFAGLNCGLGSSDQKDAVEHNRHRVVQYFGLSEDELFSLHQIHSADVITVNPGSDLGQKADAAVTRHPRILLAILTADCAPVLLADKDAQVIGAAHAGWRGALSGILENTVAAMEALGAKRSNITACIGPTISQEAYEVGPEFVQNFQDADPAALRFFERGHGDRALFDLPGFCIGRLLSAGVRSAEWAKRCTYSEPDLFYSYRRSVHQNEADYGRLISAIRL